MLRALRKKLSKTLYVQIWEHKVLVTDLNSMEQLSEPVFVTIEQKPNGQKLVVGIGDVSIDSKSTAVKVNPFSHPRHLLGDFYVAEALLQLIVKKTHTSKLVKPAPTLVIHPMEKTEGGLSPVEVRAFNELGAGTGATEVFVHEGAVLDLSDWRNNLTAEKHEQLSKPSALPQILFVVLFMGILVWGMGN